MHITVEIPDELRAGCVALPAFKPENFLRRNSLPEHLPFTQLITPANAV
jgi:hypothetical protein